MTLLENMGLSPSFGEKPGAGTLSFISANLKSQLIETCYAYLEVKKISQ